MFLIENPVLQRELLVNLRMHRAFLLLMLYVGLLAAVVYVAWPQVERVDLVNTAPARRLFDLFILGQFVLVSLMAPSFAAGSITGEKERKTYEMLLASPLRPTAVLMGKLLSSLCYLALLIFSSLPIVMLCLPLGGVNFFEVLAAYLMLILSAGTFGMICLACSSYFQRTSASLVVSYLMILPLALIGVLIWQGLSGEASEARLVLSATVAPVLCLVIWSSRAALIRGRLLHPPDVGSEGKEVVDEQRELETAVGMVIQRDQFPDKLFAPQRRNDLLDDQDNPVFAKEMQNEIFSQGTLMLRLVIQVSMFLAIPLMGFFLFVWPQQAAWYCGYVLLFNMLVGPVFSAGAVTSERERETLDLLLTTVLPPWKIIWAKLLAGLRVSTVLTLFLVPPIVLAGLMVNELWGPNWISLGIYLLIILVTCLSTTTMALFSSVFFRRTSVSLVVTYMILVLLFAVPVAVSLFAQTFFVGPEAAYLDLIEIGTLTSPFSAAFSVPLVFESNNQIYGEPIYLYFLIFHLLMDATLLAGMLWLFQKRWRVAQ